MKKSKIRSVFLDSMICYGAQLRTFAIKCISFSVNSFLPLSFSRSLSLLLSLSLSFSLLSCNEKEKKNDFSAIESKLRQDISLHPDSLLLRETLIQLYRDSGYFEKAIAMTDTLIENFDEDNRYWHIRGVLEFENEDTLAADTSFRMAYELQPNPTDAIYIARLMAYYNNPHCPDFCNEIVNRFGKDFEKECYLIKGNFFAAGKDTVKALTYFDSSIRSSYTYMEAYLQKALLLMHRKQYPEALDILKKATTVSNKYDEGYFYMGQCHEQLKDTAAANDAYNRALLANPNFTEAREALDRLFR
mgnify:CR=1 FL=1